MGCIYIGVQNQKYSVEVTFKKHSIATDTDVLELKPVKLNGVKMVVMQESDAINMAKEKELTVIERSY